jgi:hypothetical protein
VKTSSKEHEGYPFVAAQSVTLFFSHIIRNMKNYNTTFGLLEIGSHTTYKQKNIYRRIAEDGAMEA